MESLKFTFNFDDVVSMLKAALYVGVSAAAGFLSMQLEAVDSTSEYAAVAAVTNMVLLALVKYISGNGK